VAQRLAAEGEHFLAERLTRHGFAEFQNVLPQLRRQLTPRIGEVLSSCVELRASADAEARRALRLVPWTGTSLDEANELWTTTLAHFPVLQQVVRQVISDWQRNMLELARRVERDKITLERRLFNNRSAGNLIRIETNLSDPHHRGRTVAALHFERGSVIYKPRNGRCEYEWFQLLCWLNRVGFRPKLKILRLVRRRNFHWMEYVRHLPCPSEESAQRYFRRVGGLICASYLLSATDCHIGNLIATGEHPVLIDTETLCQSRTRSPKSRTPRSADILDTGWLCFDKYDVGALNSPRGGAHVCRIGNRRLTPTEYLTDLERGFTETWNLITRRHRRYFTQRLKRLRSLQWRQVLHPTFAYRSIYLTSLQPRFMRNKETRYRFLYDACSMLGFPPDTTAKEVAALSNLDIPIFRKSGEECRPLPTTNGKRVLEALMANLRYRSSTTESTCSEGIWRGSSFEHSLQCPESLTEDG
jgi:hypothetical protein